MDYREHCVPLVPLEEKHKEKLRKQKLDSFDCIVLLHFLEKFLKFATQKMVDYQNKIREDIVDENEWWQKRIGFFKNTYHIHF